MKHIKLLLLALLASPIMATAMEHAPLDKAPIDPNNQASLQRGARTFINYCLNCHSANYMRYNRLRDIGISEAVIKDNLLFAGDKVGDTMQVAMPKKDAKEWFGVTPPDLSVEVRARGEDWIYTYLRSFYRDEARPTGWNNVTYPNVAMPHILWELQGEQTLKIEKHGEHEVKTLSLVKPGIMTTAEYDSMIADLVNYLSYMSEPAKNKRMGLGLLVLLFLGFMFVVTYYLKKEYWKDIH